MAEFGNKTKRPPMRTARDPFEDDPRIDSSPPPFEEAVQLTPTPARATAPRIPPASRPPTESVAMRVAGLQEEVDRLRAARAEEADQIADVLVRIAGAERARVAAEQRIADLEEAGRALEAQLAEARAAVAADASLDVELQAAQERCGQLESEVERARSQIERATDAMRRAEEAAMASSRRAELAEHAAADAADSLRNARRELAAEQARVVDTEAKLAKVKREHGDALEAERRVHARQVEALTKQRDDERARVDLETVAALDRLRAEHAAAMKAAREERAAATAKLLEQHTKAIEAMAEEHTLALEKANAAHATDLATLDEKHTAELTAVRKELGQEKREVARQLEEERSANARLRQQAAAAEGSFGAAREAAAKAAQLLDDLERREEMASGVRAKSIADAKAALSAATAPRKPLATGAPAAQAASLDDIEMDLPE
jgi:hypothetical protein